MRCAQDSHLWERRSLVLFNLTPVTWKGCGGVLALASRVTPVQLI